MKNKIILTILTGLFCLSVLAGCSSKSAVRDIEDHNYPVAETYAADDYEFGYKQSLSGASANGGAGSVEYAPETPGTTQPTENPNVDPNKSRLLIRTVNMSVETKELDKVKTDLEIIVGADGGYIENSNMTGTGKDKNLRTLTYTIRVPADQLDAIIAAVGNSCTVLSSSENSTDVTLEYVDTKARIESLRVEYDQLMSLLKNADDLDQIITLQNRLTEVRYQIESYESRLRVLENQVTYATLNLTIREVLKETEIEPAHEPTYGERVGKQFSEMLDNTKEFFENLGLFIIACIPGIIFLGINAIIVVIIVKFVKKKKRNKIKPPISPKDYPVRTMGLVAVHEPEPKDDIMLEGEIAMPEIKEEEPVKLAGDVSIDDVKPVKNYKDPKYKDCDKGEQK